MTRSHVVVTTFHPARSAIFLLAHHDGTIAIHDARKILTLRETGVKTDGLVRHARSLHHHAPVSAVFLPGYNMRIISLGSHGKCRITDFENTVTMIITWDIGLRCSALAISPSSGYPQSIDQNLLSSTGIAKVNKTVADIPEHDNLITVGCMNGSVKTYNSIGLLQSETSGAGRSVVSLHWIRRTIVDTIKSSKSEMDLVDIDWPPVHSTPSTQGSLQSLSSRKENHRLAQEIAKIELPLGMKPLKASQPSQPRPTAQVLVAVNEDTVKSVKRRSPPRTPRRSPLHMSKSVQSRPSQPNLLAALKRRREAAASVTISPKRKNLHVEPPGSSPREAQYIPGNQMSISQKEHAVSPLPSVSRPIGHGQPSDFEARLMSGSLLASEQRRRKKHDLQPLDHPEDTTSFPHHGRSIPGDVEVNPISGALLGTQQRPDCDHPSTFCTLPPAEPPFPLRQQAVHNTNKSVKLQRMRYGYSPEDEDLIEEDADDTPDYNMRERTAHHRRQKGAHRSLHTPPPPMPGHYIPSPSSSLPSEDEATYEDAQEYDAHEIRGLGCNQDVYPHSGEHRCSERDYGCSCADIVREEMALVRGELAGLRKTVWVLAAGLGVESREIERWDVENEVRHGRG